MGIKDGGRTGLEAKNKEWLEALKSTTHWRTKDGREIPIGEMGDGHLVATAGFLINWAEKQRIKRLLEMLFAGPNPDDFSDHSMDAFDGELNASMDADYRDFLPPVFKSIEAEAAKRGIEGGIRALSLAPKDAVAREMAYISAFQKRLAEGRRDKGSDHGTPGPGR